MIEELINSISNKSINDFFRQKATSYRSEEEDLEHLLGDQEFEDFSNLTKLGEAEYDGTDELLVFSCQYKNELSSRSSKKKQYDIAKKVLKEEFKDAAIFIFYDDKGKFRLSLIRTNYLGAKKSYTNWKRFTYFVDPAATNKTFRVRIEKCNFSSLDEIQEAFSVEPLNKEFYDKIVKAFYGLVGGEVGTGRNQETLAPNLALPGGEKDRTIVRQFGTRLVGRIIFCWFLKHKSSANGISLIPNGWISSTSVSDNYYHSILEILFFEILNKTKQDRPKNLPDGNELVPFLNGGLFEPQIGTDSDYYALREPKANYQLKISDDWFKELFNVLEQYNFTIDENSINDAEVSIDPEMLGRIFENLLAEIDPNLSSAEKTSVRKATGSFYTPREIVDYMAEEALVKYLHNKTQCSEKELMNLFKEEATIDFSDQEKEAILSAFDQVKILDPAAGSGAFPMGCLHKIVVALQKLDPGAESWKQKQLDRVTSAALRDVLKATLDRSNAEYARKLGVLQHCIYGTDIHPLRLKFQDYEAFCP
jgi:adenine-specific DNA-methyltransferase